MTKRKAEPVSERVCGVCGAKGPVEGPLPWEWDAHPTLTCTAIDRERGVVTYADGPLELSCSAACRAKAGLRERKGAV